MNAILLLSVVMAGPFKANAPPVAPARPDPARRPPVMAPRHVIAIYTIHHEGLTFRVRGYYSPGLKRIVWNEDDEFNQRSYSIALVSQATFGDAQEEPLSPNP